MEITTLFDYYNEEDYFEQNYVVEKIIDKKLKDGSIFYLVKWKDFPENQITWEPLENLSFDLIEEFENSLRVNSQMLYDTDNCLNESFKEEEKKKKLLFTIHKEKKNWKNLTNNTWLNQTKIEEIALQNKEQVSSTNNQSKLDNNNPNSELGENIINYK